MTAARRPGGRHKTMDGNMNAKLNLQLGRFDFISNINCLVYRFTFQSKEYIILKHAVSDYDIGSTHELFQTYLWIGTFGFLCTLFSIVLNQKTRFNAIFSILLGLVI